MALEVNGINCILNLKKDNVAIESIATIGRQNFYFKKNDLKKIFDNFNILITPSDFEKIYENKFIENLLQFVGAKKIDSFDFSGYERATFLHDMNEPVSDEYKNKYDVVFDGGSLEHIFNFPCAIKNYMEMLKIGGFLVQITVCNNFSGHGFYQFSPELFFRIFNKNNGFKIRTLYIDDTKHTYSVVDPEVVQRRVIFKNSRSTYLVVVAQKIEQKNIFESLPMQSDYVPLWRENNNITSIVLKKTNIILRLVNKFNLIFRSTNSYDKRMFKRIS